MKKTLIAMAAGMGSRFGGLKQATKFGTSGKVILDFAIEDAIESGFDKVVFVIRSDIEQIFREDVSKKYEDKIDVRYVFQDKSGQNLPSGRTKPWGTGHAVLSAINDVNESFIAINADDYYGRSVYKLVADFIDENNPNKYALAGYLLKNTLSENGTVSRGICEYDDSLNLKSVSEFTGLEKKSNTPMQIVSNQGRVFSGEEYTSLNFWAFPKDFMQTLAIQFENFLSINSKSEKAEFYLPSAVDTSIKTGIANAQILPTDEKWQGVTYKEDMPAVEKFLEENKRI